MGSISRAGWRLERLVARYFRGELPEPDVSAWWLAPLPRWLEDIALRLAWPIVAINLAGTVFGVWYYYQLQLPETPTLLWPLVVASPLATLLMALSLASWRLGRDIEWVHTLAFFGNVQFGLWTPYVQLVLEPPGLAPWLYWFLVTSHLLMFLQAFLLQRYARFPVGAVAVATGWHTLNLVTDYFVQLLGTYTHPRLRAKVVDGTVDHTVPAHDHAAAAAAVLVVLCVFLSLSTRLAKERAG